MHDVITIGAATRDIFIRSTAFEVHSDPHQTGADEGCFPLGAKIEIDELVFETGGGATNAAVTFGRLGHKTAIISAVGEDQGADEIIGAIGREGVSSEYMQRIPHLQTGTSIIAVAGSGERTVLVYRGAASAIAAAAVPWDKVQAKWFYISSVGGNFDLMNAALLRAGQGGIKVAWNPGAKELGEGLEAVAPLIKQADVFNLNREEAAQLCGKPVADLAGIIDALRIYPKKLLVVTDGKAGAYAATRDAILWSGIIDVPRLNVTGAGDAFGSGVVAGFLKTDDVRYALAVGTWNATGVVQQMGAKRGLLRTYPSDLASAKVPIKPWP
jgi:sugar/nucleoside kinase (ribokinase family)